MMSEFTSPAELEASYEFTKAQIAELESLRAQLKEAELAEGRAKTRAMRLEMALADTEALELATSDRLEKTMAQLKEAQAEIERLKAENIAFACNLRGKHATTGATYEILRTQLAASQANEVQLREALSHIEYAEAENGCIMTAGECSSIATEALSLPSDTTAIEAMIQKAGEVMRERCADACTETYRPFYWDKHGGSEEWPVNNSPEDCSKAIRALPGVTLEDLK